MYRPLRKYLASTIIRKVGFYCRTISLFQDQARPRPSVVIGLTRPTKSSIGCHRWHSRSYVINKNKRLGLGETSWIFESVRHRHSSTEMDIPPRRAVLYVPGNDERKLSKLSDLEVDCAVMDCEDGVAISRKVEARKTIRRMLDELETPGVRDLVVRINSVSSGLAEEDMNEIFLATRLPKTLMLPKVDSKAEVQWFSEQLRKHLSKRDTQHRIKVVLFTETAIGLLRLEEILEESERLSEEGGHFKTEGVVFGSDDFCASIGASRSPDAYELLYARQKIVATAKAYGLQAIDLVYIDYKDLEGLERQSLEGARMGFTGKQVIHPSQIPIVQKSFSPSHEKMEWAKGLIESFEEHQKSGKVSLIMQKEVSDLFLTEKSDSSWYHSPSFGEDVKPLALMTVEKYPLVLKALIETKWGAFTYRGSMIDMPLVLQARNILNMANIT